MENYRKIEIKGKGSYGQAILVQSVVNRKFYIMKVIDASLFDKKQKENALNEIHVLKSLQHPFIVRYRESFVDKSRYLCIVMDYAENGTLEQLIVNQRKLKHYFTEDSVLDWFTQIVLAIKYIHDKKIIHRDIKTQNVFLLKDNTIKLGDFGIARILTSSEDLCQTSIGTPYYISPEMCQHQPYNHKSDIWSLGCILFELLTLRHPFDAKSILFLPRFQTQSGLEGLIIKIIRGQTPEIPQIFSKNIRDLTIWLLTADPEQRPSIDDILNTDIVKEKTLQIYQRLKKSQSDQSSAQKEKIRVEERTSPFKIIPPINQPLTKTEQVENIRCQIEKQLDMKQFMAIYAAIEKDNLELIKYYSSKIKPEIMELIVKLVELEISIFIQ